MHTLEWKTVSPGPCFNKDIQQYSAQDTHSAECKKNPKNKKKENPLVKWTSHTCLTVIEFIHIPFKAWVPPIVKTNALIVHFIRYWSANHTAASQCIKSYRQRSRALFTSNIRTKKKCDLYKFDHGKDIGTRWAGLIVFGSAGFHTQQSLEFTQNSAKKHKMSCVQRLCSLHHQVNNQKVTEITFFSSFCYLLWPLTEALKHSVCDFMHCATTVSKTCRWSILFRSVAMLTLSKIPEMIHMKNVFIFVI